MKEKYIKVVRFYYVEATQKIEVKGVVGCGFSVTKSRVKVMTKCILLHKSKGRLFNHILALHATAVDYSTRHVLALHATDRCPGTTRY